MKTKENATTIVDNCYTHGQDTYLEELLLINGTKCKIFIKHDKSYGFQSRAELFLWSGTSMELVYTIHGTNVFIPSITRAHLIQAAQYFILAK